MKLKPSAFAREAGVTRQAVRAQMKKGLLVVDAAGFLDTDNPINSAYISARSRRGAHRTANSYFPESNIAPTRSLLEQQDAEFAKSAGVPAELLTMTLRDLVIRFNGLYGLEKHAKILRDVMMAIEKEQKIQERGLKLIEKDFVTSRLFQYIEVLMKQIVEYPESVTDTVIAKVLSEGPEARGTLVVMLRDGLGRIIAGAKDQIISELESLKGKYTGNASEESLNESG